VCSISHSNKTVHKAALFSLRGAEIRVQNR